MADDEAIRPLPERGDPSWVEPALTPDAVTRRVGKTPVFFGPPLARLTESGRHTMEISGILNRTAERYLALKQHHGLELSEPERQCVAHICGIGFLSPLEITELGLEVRLTPFDCEGLDKAALADKLDAAPFVDLLMLVETLGF